MPKAYCDGHIDAGNIQLSFGSSYTKIEFKKETGIANSNGNISNKAGDFVENLVSFFLPKIKPELGKFANKLRNQRVVVFTIDNNETVRFYPSLRFNASSTTGTSFKDKNGFTISLSGRSVKQPIILTNWTTDAIISDKLILVSPSGNRFLVSVQTTASNQKYLFSESYPVGNDPQIVLSDANSNFRWKITDKGSFTTLKVNQTGVPSITIDSSVVSVNNQGSLQVQ